MGCGISRYDSTHIDHDFDRRSTAEFCIGDVDEHSNIIPPTRNDGRLLFVNNNINGEHDCRMTSCVSPPALSPVLHVKHMAPATLQHDERAGPQRLMKIDTQLGSQMEFPATQKRSSVEEIRRNLENPCSHDHVNYARDHQDHKHDNLEIRKSSAKCLWDDDDDDVNDGRISNCNLEDMNGTGGGASPLFMGSPSFREYCIDVGCRSSSSDDHLNPDINNYNIGNEDLKEREEKMWRKDNNIRDSNHEGSSGSNVTGAVKKTRTRRFKKVSSSIHKPRAVRSLMNVASCYHPHPSGHHHSHPHNNYDNNHNVSARPN